MLAVPNSAAAVRDFSSSSAIRVSISVRRDSSVAMRSCVERLAEFVKSNV
jgi:hypothetical protein